MRWLKYDGNGDVTLPPGSLIVISVGIAALTVGIPLKVWLDGNVGKPELWIAATALTAFLAVGIAVFGVYHDRAQAKKEREYMARLSKIDKKVCAAGKDS